MRKKLSKSIIAVIVMLSLLSEAWSTSFQSNKPIINNAPDDVEIKDVINSYFKLRYETFSTLILGDFSDLLATSDEAKAFQHAEFGKLTIEIKNAEKNQLRYTSYNFSLVFSKIRFDNSFQTATVHVTEENSVVYEISQEASPTNPVISSISNLKHTITLREEQSGWRIVSDYYDDLLWRLIRETGVSIDEVIRTVDVQKAESSGNYGMQASVSCQLPPDSSSYQYDRVGAREYAITYAETLNPAYDNYDGQILGGDCTNFVSQAMHEGGGASMVYLSSINQTCNEADNNGYGCVGTAGWYYTDPFHRAAAWTDVSFLHTFIIGEASIWPEGPEGCEVPQDQAEIGDLLQYYKGNIWAHSVIIVDVVNGVPYVASHSPFFTSQPFTIIPDYSNTRFIRIERIDGNAPPTPTLPPPTLTPPPTDTPVPTTPPPSSNYALRFQPETVSEAILMPPAPNLDFGADMTAEFWIRTTSVYGGSVWYDSQWILDKDVPGFSTPDWGIAVSQGRITSSMGSGVSPINNGAWHHVALVRNATSGQLTIYIDGIQDATAFPGFTSIGNTLALIVGSENGVGGPLAHAYSEDLDELRIWNVVRLQSEIQANMAVPLTGNETGLVGYWDFNEGSGQIVHDKSQTQAHGQLGSSPDADAGDPQWILAPELFNGIPPTPIPTPTGQTPTPPPTSTPEPCNCFWDNCSTASQGIGAKVASLSKGLVFVVGNLDRITDQAALLYRVRDELLSATDEGQHFIDTYYEHSEEIASLMGADSDLAEQGLDVIDALTPNLQALLDGQGSTVVVTSEQIQQAQAFLDALLPYASPALQQAIADEQERHPLEQLNGKTMDQAWVHLNGYPSTPLLDDFDRADGAIGSNWSGNTFGYNIASNRLSVDYSGSNSDIYWSNEPFGADQEAYVTFTQIDPNAGEQDLLLKAQSNSTWGDGVLEVLYDPSGQRVQVWTYDWPAGWVQHGADIPVTFVDGDQFGARALVDGTVEVYRNGELLATRDIDSWSHYADGGHIGLWFIGAEDAVLDDFGGGTISGGMQSMSMGGGAIASQSTETSLTPEQSNVTLTNVNVFWQGVPMGSNQKAYVTFARLDKDTGTVSKPQSNGAWGEGIVQAFYDVVGGRIQVWMYDPQKGWVQYGEDIPVRFAEGDTFSVRVLANGMVEIQRNGKLLGKRDVTP